MKEPTKEQKINAMRQILTSKGYVALEIQADQLCQHVDVHRYFLAEKIPFPITWHDALFSWYELIFVEIEKYLGSRFMKFLFPDLRGNEVGPIEASREAIDTFFVLSDDIYQRSVRLKIQKESIEPTVYEVVADYILYFSKKPYWLRKLMLLFL